MNKRQRKKKLGKQMKIVSNLFKKIKITQHFNLDGTSTIEVHYLQHAKKGNK